LQASSKQYLYCLILMQFLKIGDTRNKYKRTKGR
jgi:hypothetical protein